VPELSRKRGLRGTVSKQNLKSEEEVRSQNKTVFSNATQVGLNGHEKKGRRECAVQRDGRLSYLSLIVAEREKSGR